MAKPWKVPKTNPVETSFTQEENDASRARAAGRPMGPPNKELAAWAGGQLMDRLQRTVIGNYERKGRAPTYTLSPGQFAQFQSTGEWEGMPTPEEYGPQSYVPEDKEYTPFGGDDASE